MITTNVNIQQLSDDSAWFSVSEARGILNAIPEPYLLDKDEDKKFIHCEAKSLVAVAHHLEKNGSKLNINFCSKQQALGYDGVLGFNDGTKTKVEITRAGYGFNESLISELIDANGCAPFDQQIIYDGTSKHNRSFPAGKNEPRAHILSDISLQLAEAFKKKLKSKYKGNYLIITIPNAFFKKAEIFYEQCNNFWKDMPHQDIFSRVFILNEYALDNVWDSALLESN